MVEIARQLADEFRERAPEDDRTGELPTANDDRMREEGYLRVLVPSELGGMGAGYLEMAHAQQALARGCASTALAVNMHQFQIGFMGDMWRMDRGSARRKDPPPHRRRRDHPRLYGRRGNRRRRFDDTHNRKA